MEWGGEGGPGQCGGSRRSIVPAGHGSEQRLRVELQEARIRAYHAPRDGRARQRVEALGLERLDLARHELELLRDIRELEALRLPRLGERTAYAEAPAFGRGGADSVRGRAVGGA